MAKLIMPIVLVLSFLLVSCDSSDDIDDIEVHPIRFEQSDYTIRFGITSHISFVNGSGMYELTASNPDVLGDFYMDVDNRVLIVRPSKVGKSTLTITDVITNTSVTLDFTVEDFYLSFRVSEIEGDNHNPYLSVGNEIRFIRDEENSRMMKVMMQNKVTYDVKCIAYGNFDIERSESNIFTLNMALHSQHIEELETFSYTMSGDKEYMAMFEKYFDYKWEHLITSRSQPVKQIKMILTDHFNGCKISCSLQPF